MSFSMTKCCTSEKNFPAKKRNVVPLVKVNGVAQRIDKVSSEAKMLLEEFLNFKDKTYAYVEGIKKIDW